MKIDEAPPPGWYPDPLERTRLRWWDGTDWADERRPMPSPEVMAELAGAAEAAARAAQRSAGGIDVSQAMRASGTSALSRDDAQELLTEVREVARAEVDRAADVFTQRARAASREIEPLISKYTSQVVRWVRFVAILAVVLAVGWVLFQTFVQASFFEWLGDRIDAATDT